MDRGSTVSVVRVHASPDPEALDRVRSRLASFDEVDEVVVSPGELVGDTVEVLVAGELDVMREGEIRAAILEEIDLPTTPPAARRTVLDEIARLEAEIASLRTRVGAEEATRSGALHVSATHDHATVEP